MEIENACIELILETSNDICEKLECFENLSKITTPPQNWFNFCSFPDPFDISIKQMEMITRVAYSPRNLLKEPIKGMHLPICSDSELLVVNHVRVASQCVYNLCGYHVMHSFLNFARMFKLSACKCSSEATFRSCLEDMRRSRDSINEPSSFWQFHRNMTEFLYKFTRSNPERFIPDKYPWRDHDLLQGDYERIYNEIYFGYHPLYKSLLSSDDNTLVKTMKLQMQFGKLVDQDEELVKLQIEITQFKSDKKHPKKLFFLLLAATNHWVGFAAVVNRGKQSFYFFDSSNYDYLGINEIQVGETVEKMRQLNRFGTEWNDFKTLCAYKRIQDIQIFTNMLPRLFSEEANMSIFDYYYNYQFLPFYERFTRKSVLFEISKLREAHEEDQVYDLVNENFDELRDITRIILNNLKKVEHLNQDTTRNLIVIFLETEKILKRCIKVVLKKSNGTLKRRAYAMRRDLKELEQLVQQNRGRHEDIFAFHNIINTI